jgi:putative glutamine amidotransferase
VTPQSAESRPPRIGLTTYRETAAWGVWHESADLLPASYADAVTSAGGAVVLLPPAAPAADLERLAAATLDGVHGLILSGGPDVDPARYGADRDENTGPAREGRDGWEITLARDAVRRELPLLAICRGIQVLNVALGGTLVQHLPDVVGHSAHCPVVGEHGRHEVRLDPDSRVGALLGSAATVATYHHQGLDELGTGLVATGWADDGVVEAVDLAGPGWVAGVQWHPEVTDSAALFGGFVAACIRHRDALQAVG